MQINIKKHIIIILMILGFATSVNAKYDNLDFKKNIEEHRTLSSAVGISLNSQDEIALGFEDGYINVYDTNGKFKYGYSFKLNGSYVFEYDEFNNIMIFPIRAGACFFYNSDTELIKIREFSNHTEEGRYYRSLENNMKFNINDNFYELKQSFGYTELTRTFANGNKTIIYKTNWNYAGRVLIGAFTLVFIIIVISFIVKAFRTNLEKQGNRT